MTILIEDASRDWLVSEAYWLARMSIESLGEAIFMVREPNNIVYANMAARRITGYSLDELTNAHMRDVIPALDPEALMAVGDAPGRHVAFESEVRGKDGRIVLASVAVTRKWLYNANQYVVAAWDITGRKRAE